MRGSGAGSESGRPASDQRATESPSLLAHGISLYVYPPWAEAEAGVLHKLQKLNF
jgi:hypothetical protein